MNDFAQKEAKKQIMRAARHLPANRMAWVANEFASGVDYVGCSKGLIAESLASSKCYGCGAQLSIYPERLEELLLQLRIAVNTKGESAATEDDRDGMEMQISVLARHLKKERARCVVARKQKNTYNRCFSAVVHLERRIDKYKKALARLGPAKSCEFCHHAPCMCMSDEADLALARLP